MRRGGSLRIALLTVVLLMAGGTVVAAPTPGTVHFTAAGDFAAGSNSAAVLDKISDLDSDLTLALGDLSYGTTGQEQAWCDFVTSRVGAGYPFELLSGNHESNGQNGNINDFAACLPNQLPGVVGTYGRQYYVDVPADNPLVRFVQISPALPYPGPEGTWSYAAGSPRYTWTAQAIDGARAEAIPWVVVGMHKPCISVGQYACDPGTDLFNLLLSKKVDLILNGHEHAYMRSKQLALSGACPAVTPNAYDADCVADGDDTMVKGAGSVVAVVGTGGVGQRDVNASDPEAGYFAVTGGANANPTWGPLDVSATADELRASFVRASGGTLTDSFSITRSTTPNSPPVSSFTSSCAGLSCSFDGSGSADPDGTIAGYAWTFGDGGTATGPTPAHAYAVEGTYTVRLTVTDDAGGTASSTRTVTVTAPATTTYASDQFSRTVSNGFGSAPTGGPWTLGGPATLFAVADGFGTIRAAAGTGPAAYLDGVSAPSSDLRLAFALDKQPTGSGLYLSAFGRRTPGGSYYAKARITGTGAVILYLVRRPTGGGEVALQSALQIPGLTHTPGDTLLLRLQTTGASPTTVRAKVWKAGTPEPGTWQRSVTDSTAGLQTAGSVGVSPYLSSGATNGPLTVRLDELTVQAP